MTALSKVLTTDPSALGNDGSQAVYYYRAGAVNKLVLHLQGGGLCYNKASCDQRAIDYPTFMTYNNAPATYNGGGILSDSAVLNPDFDDWHSCYIPYATSDCHTGTGSNDGRYFRGWNVVQAVITQLALSPTEVVFSGSSAGGIGVLALADAVADLYSGATVKALCDSGWLMDIVPYGSTAVRPWWQLTLGTCYWSANRDITKYLPAAYNSITTPVFVSMCLADATQLGALGITGSTAPEVAYAAVFGRAVLNSLQRNPYVAGCFAPVSVQHGLAIGATWNSVTISGYSLREIFGNWYSGGSPARMLGTVDPV